MSSADTSAAPTIVGPVQVLVVGFGDDRFTGEIMPELKRLREHDVIRLIDLLFVTKDKSGNIAALQQTDLSREEMMEFGAFVGALVGFGAGGEEEAERAALAGAVELEDSQLFDDADVWYLADAVPEGTSAAIALIEHRWAIPLREKIQAAGGVALADQWLHPEDLIAVGLAAAGAGSAGA
jgi:uncharacterized membrane protein